MRTSRALMVIVAAAVVFGGGVLALDRAGGADDGGEPSVDDIIRLAGTESQAVYLADGRVTAEEREAAFWEWVECMEAGGVEVTGYTLHPRGGEEINVASQLSDDGEQAIVLHCRDEHVLAVSVIYAMLHGPTEQEQVEVAARVTDCMHQHGVDVPAGLTLNELIDLDSQASYCYDEIRREKVAP